MVRTSSIASLDDVSVRYPDRSGLALEHETWQVPEGAYALVVGRSGSGKSTLLRCLNGLVPHFSGGAFGGRVMVAGLDTRSYAPRRLSRHVSFVFQDPESQLVTERVDHEIAFGMEQHGLDRPTMRKRVEEALDYLGLSALRHRRPSELSGGERQRLAIASAVAMHPRLLVLDEPTSQLDPWGAEEVMAVLDRLNDDVGVTIVIAEHRLERLLVRADVVRAVSDHSDFHHGTPLEYVRDGGDPTPLPPVTRLGLAVGEATPPLTVKDARRTLRSLPLPPTPVLDASPSRGDVVSRVEGLGVRLGDQVVLEDLDLDISQGELVAVMGRNGSGKTTLLRSLAGLQRADRGRVTTLGIDMSAAGPAALKGAVGYVPQRSANLFHEERLGDAIGRNGDLADVLDQFGLAGHAETHPLDLSGGERERAALATVMARQPRLLLIDEPTRGMDAWRKLELAAILTRLRQAGIAIVMVTHDVELVVQCATRVVLLGDRGIVSDGTSRQVLCGSIAYTTQINKVFGGTWLTVEDVTSALDAAR
jgi:energy-coupling factor transport system ATP-binding protein